MSDKANGYYGGITRMDKRNGKTLIDLFSSIADYANAAYVQKQMNRVNIGEMSATEYRATLDRLSGLFSAKAKEFYAQPPALIGTCSYSGFDGEKTGFAQNAFSSKASDTSITRTNKDVKPKRSRNYGKNSSVARRVRKNPPTVTATVSPIDRTKDARETFAVSEEFAANMAASAKARETRNAEITAIFKANKNTFLTDRNGQRRFSRADAVEVWRSRNA